MTECWTALALLSLALTISVCLNIIFCIRRKATLCKDDCCCSNIYDGEGPSQNEGHDFHNRNHHELEENPHNHHEQQENPIYGNISTERRVEVCYEMMTKQQMRDHTTSLGPDLNYASLDLKVAKKRKKHCRQQGQTQGRNSHQDQLPPMNAFLELEGDTDAHLPSKDISTMVSHSSIYLNSQQIAQETEEMEREWSINMGREDMGWEGIRRREEGGSEEWKGEEDSEERKDVRQDVSNGIVQLSEVQAIQSGANHFISSFNHDSDQ
uniref:uncharacterized protein LOC109959312 n=1 Tax=Monopterus albus TaxID=43700 RepID=UPI0009B4457C|nr:uncharacterized protein LOC109959312 [Monopterus albus]